jgi:hypothetical protein
MRIEYKPLDPTGGPEEYVPMLSVALRYIADTASGRYNLSDPTGG